MHFCMAFLGAIWVWGTFCLFLSTFDGIFWRLCSLSCIFLDTSRLCPHIVQLALLLYSLPIFAFVSRSLLL